ncbi:hypothetical protein HG531_005628 [Fusarium graminearum]|nr:hypothetical protein HG531_005628 [Fusarium graminearum]
MLREENDGAGEGLATGEIDLAKDSSSDGSWSNGTDASLSDSSTEAGGGGGEEARTAGGNSGSGIEADGASSFPCALTGGDLLNPPRRKGSAGGVSISIRTPVSGDLLNPPPRNGLKSSSIVAASPGRVGVGASLTIRLVAKRAARASEGLSKVNCAEVLAVGNFCGDLDILRSNASG